MKKLMTVAVMVGAVSIASAQTVTSANVVGYSKETLKTGFNMVRTPFVAGGQNAVELQEVFDTSVLLQGGNAGAADNIFFWNPVASEYEAYFLHDGSGKGNTALAGKWVDSSVAISADVVLPKEGFFFVRNDVDVEVLVSGEVVEASTNSLDLLMGFNMVANPFSAEWKLNDGSMDWIAVGAIAGGNAGASDNIFFWDVDNSEYIAYYLHDGSGKGNTAKAGKWVDSVDAVNDNLSSGLNQGFFYVRSGVDVTLDIAPPYTLD